MLAQLCDKTTALAGGGVCVHRVKSLMYQTYYITITGKAFSKTHPSHDADLLMFKIPSLNVWSHQEWSLYLG